MNVHGNAEPAGRDFLQYWVWRRNRWIGDPAERERPIDYSPSNQFARLGVQPGDTLWIVTLKEQRLLLLSPLVIEFLSSRREAERLLKRRDLWDDTDWYAINLRSQNRLRQVDITDLAATLRFATKHDRLRISRGRIDGKQLQALRQLTPESAARLRECWGIEHPAESEHRSRSVPMTQNEKRLQNLGTPAERVVHNHLTAQGFAVEWTGDQLGLGYDLIARRHRRQLFVEVKSSFGICTPTLTESEWKAAQQHGAAFVLALVDHVGKASEHLWYVRNPAATLTPARVSAFRFQRGALTDSLVSTP